MKNGLLVLTAISLAALAIAAFAVAKPDKAMIAQGDYLVNRVTFCGHCHTPMVNGQPDAKRFLAGAPMMPKPKGRTGAWASKAPNLTPAGPLKSWSDKALAKFMMTGVTPDGDRANPPMPSCRLKESDAKAVTAYLRSVPAVK
jgi:hypothetical protein